MEGLIPFAFPTAVRPGQPHESPTAPSPCTVCHQQGPSPSIPKYPPASLQHRRPPQNNPMMRPSEMMFVNICRMHSLTQGGCKRAAGLPARCWLRLAFSSTPRLREGSQHSLPACTEQPRASQQRPESGTSVTPGHSQQLKILLGRTSWVWTCCWALFSAGVSPGHGAVLGRGTRMVGRRCQPPLEPGGVGICRSQTLCAP